MPSSIARRQRFFLVAYGLVACAMLWPVYALAAHALPLIFGLPLPLAWLAGCILVLFAALCFLYAADCRAEEREG